MPLNEYTTGGAADTDAPVIDAAPDAPMPATPDFAVLAVDLIAPSPTNPRKHFDEAKLAELATSIRASGVHQPILVRPLPAGRLAETFNAGRAAGRRALPTHELIAGERRLRACKLAGVATIPAMIKHLTDAQVIEVQIVENLQRDDLSELEEAEGYQALINATGIQKEAIGDKIGRSRTYVYGRLKLLELCQPARQALREGRLDASRALLIARIPNEKLQIKALKEFLQEDYRGDAALSYRGAKAWVEQNVMLRLEHAPFSTDDAQLLQAAGSCAECPKRTGNDRDLFADVNAPDLCTDPGCFDQKKQAHIDAITERANAKGMEVIAGAEAREVKPWQQSNTLRGFADLDAPLQDSADQAKPTTLRDLLNRGELKGQVKVFVDPYTGQTLEVVPDDLADTGRARLRGELLEGASDNEADERNWQAEREAQKAAEAYESRWRTNAVDAIVQGLACGLVAGFETPLLRAMLILMTDNELVDAEVIRAVLPLDPENEYPDGADIRAAVALVPDSALGARICELLARHEADQVTDWVRDPDGTQRHKIAPALVIESLAATCGIDLQAMKAETGGGETVTAEPGTLQVGACVRFRKDLKGMGGKVRKVSGREGTIESKIGDGAWSVRYGKGKHETAIADHSELELVTEGGEA